MEGRIIAIDPGLTAFGLVCVERGAAGEWAVSAKTIRPARRRRKEKLTAARARRVRAIAAALRAFAAEHGAPSIIGVELPQGHKNAAAAWALGAAFGLVVGWAAEILPPNGRLFCIPAAQCIQFAAAAVEAAMPLPPAIAAAVEPTQPGWWATEHERDAALVCGAVLWLQAKGDDGYVA